MKKLLLILVIALLGCTKETTLDVRGFDVLIYGQLTPGVDATLLYTYKGNKPVSVEIELHDGTLKKKEFFVVYFNAPLTLRYVGNITNNFYLCIKWKDDNGQHIFRYDNK